MRRLHVIACLTVMIGLFVVLFVGIHSIDNAANLTITMVATNSSNWIDSSLLFDWSAKSMYIFGMYSAGAAVLAALLPMVGIFTGYFIGRLKEEGE